MDSSDLPPEFTGPDEGLLDWYEREAADLPWRRSRDPWAIWLAEIMLQQTQVGTVIPYYERFLGHFPDIASLAAADLDEVLKLWEGLGYYRRARNLQRAARQVMEAYDGCLPHRAADLQRLPGIGRYSAGAIASIAFGEAAAVLDGNVMRVFARLTDLDEDITRSATQRRLWALAQAWLHPTRPGAWNQALMELGRRVCRPRQPDCPRCPLQTSCLARARGTQAQRPRRRPRPARPHHDHVVALLRNAQGELLIQRRPEDELLGGLWTFPGGRAKAEDASLEAALQRCLRETLGLEARPGAALAPVQHGFTHFRITLHAWECALVCGPEESPSPETAWVQPEELDSYSFGGAERALIANWLTAATRGSATPR
ncbi:MAG: A/G-specific adenine glycosylase [Anaerolineaceae bacterium]|nr:A/G-specific adenine glycosylase [Anaerolineaceae bacterium]